jgi:hypothetical protein
MATTYKCKRECTIRVRNFDKNTGEELPSSYKRVKKGEIAYNVDEVSQKHFKAINKPGKKPNEKSK